jgi:hypothetical protein
LETDSAEFDPRGGHQVVSFANGLYVIGGISRGPKPFSDVWESKNGRTWNRIVNEAPFSVRTWFNAFSWKNEMWIISGADLYNGGRQYNDAWKSGDGTNWELVKDSLPWKYVLGNKTVTATEDSLWAIGGEGTQGSFDFLDYIWKSGDGKTWKKVDYDPEFPERAGHTATWHQGRIYLIGGLGKERVLDDVWATVDSTLGEP